MSGSGRKRHLNQDENVRSTKRPKREDTEIQQALENPIRQPSIHYNVGKFDPKNLRLHSTVLFGGGRRTGKSFAMRDFMYHMRKNVYDAQIFSGTYDDDHPWHEFTPLPYVSYVKEEFPHEVLSECSERQEKRKLIARKHHVKCPPSMLVFEDLEYLKKSMWNDPGIRSVMFNGRWRNTYVFLAVQYIMEIKMALRGMFDYALFTMENSAAVRKRIYEQFGGIFPTLQDFESVFFECTKDHRCMVIDCRATSYNVKEVVFWYKASDHGTFKIGSPEVWDPNVEEQNRLQLQRNSASSTAGPPKRVGRGGKAGLDVGVLLDGDEEIQCVKRRKLK